MFIPWETPPAPPPPPAPTPIWTASTANADGMGAPRTVHSHGNWAMHVALSARGNIVLSTGLDGALVTRVGAATSVVTRSVATQCALNDVGSMAALALRDGTVRVFDVAASKPFEIEARSHPGMLHACGVAMGGRARAMCFTGSTRHAVVLSGPGGSHSVEFDGQGRGVAVSADGGRVAYAAANSRVAVADVATGALRKPLATFGTKDDVGVALDAMGRTLAISDANGVRLVDMRDRPARIRTLAGHTAPGAYGRVAISRDGRRVIASERGGFGVWDASGVRVAALRVPAVAFCNGCAIAPAGDMAVTAASDGAVRMWRIVSGIGAFVRRRETTGDVQWWKTPRSLLSR